MRFPLRITVDASVLVSATLGVRTKPVLDVVLARADVLSIPAGQLDKAWDVLRLRAGIDPDFLHATLGAFLDAADVIAPERLAAHEDDALPAA